MGAGDPQDLVVQIRRSVLEGHFAAGQRLVESELSDLYQVSRATVRQALRELVADGLGGGDHADAGALVSLHLDQAVRDEFAQCLPCLLYTSDAADE